VVGLHPNTFKPHTGTKTSVLFVQKYSKQQLADIARVHDEVAKDCPAYETEIEALLAAHAGAVDIPDAAIPEAVADLISETFSEPEPEEASGDSGVDENGEAGDEAPASQEELTSQAEERLDALKTAFLKAKQNLLDLGSDQEALEQKKQQEIDALTSAWDGEKGGLRLSVQEMNLTYKVNLKTLKAAQKAREKKLKAEIKSLEKQVFVAAYQLKLLTNRGKLKLILADGDLIGTLKERWIAAEVAKRLDYPIFMAVSERGGKDNSGDYRYMLDEKSQLIEDASGQPRIDQDLVNYDLTAEELADAASISDEKLCVAEAFVRFAQEQGLQFWRAE